MVKKMFGKIEYPEDEKDIETIKNNEWTKISGRGDIGDMNWGASTEGFEKEDIEPEYEKLLEHLGKTILVSGGGGRGFKLGTLKDANIIEFNGGHKIRVELEDVRPSLLGKDSFSPVLDSWQISVKDQ